MNSEANSPLPSWQNNGRIDLFRILVGEDSAQKKLAVTAAYVHALKSLLPVRAIRTMLRDEFEPEEINPLLARCFKIATDELNTHFFQALHKVSIVPLRSETFGAAPQAINWHFFSTNDADNVVAVVRSLPIEIQSES